MSKRPVTAARPTTPRLSAPADAPDLLLQLGDRAAELAAAQDKLTRLATDSAALDGERQAAASLLSAEREKFADVKAVLERALEEQTARAEGLQRALADAQQQLSAAQAGAAAAAAAAEQRHAAEIAQQQAVLDSQRDRMQQVEALLAERDALRAQAEALQAQVQNDRHALHRRIMELERQHALDREVWRQDTALAVQQAREEMAALTDQRLDATAQQALLRNAEMAAELAGQSRHVQGVLAHNAAMQREATQLRTELGVARAAEQELAAKALACERTIQSLLARLATVEAQRSAGEAALADVSAQLTDAQTEGRAAVRLAADQARRLEEVEGALAAARQELGNIKTSQDDAAPAQAAPAGPRSGGSPAGTKSGCYVRSSSTVASMGAAKSSPSRGSLRSGSLPRGGHGAGRA